MCAYVCVCVCARAHVCVCACACVCVQDPHSVKEQEVRTKVASVALLPEFIFSKKSRA